MGAIADRIRRLGRQSAVPSEDGAGVGYIDEREQAIIDRHTSEAKKGNIFQKAARGAAKLEIAERRQWRTYAEQAPPEIAEPVKEMLSNLDDRAKVRSIYQKLTPEQRQEALRLVPGISQQLGDDRGGAVGRTLKSLRGGIANVIQPGMELVGTGGTPEEIAFIRQLEAAESQEFAPALPSDPWYERFPLQAAEMVPFMAATGAGNIVGTGIAKAGGNVLARGAAAGVPGAKVALQAAGAVGKLPTAVGLPAATAQATIARAGGAAGITSVGFPGQYAQEIDQLKELGVEDGPGMQALAVGTSLVSSALEAIMPNPFKGVLPAGAVSIRDGATTAARQYLWEAIKRAPPEISEEYAQGLASGLGKTVASYLDMTTKDVSVGDAFATSFEQGNAALGPMAFLLGVPALAGAGAVGLRARAGTPPGPPPVPPAVMQAPLVQPSVVAPGGIPPAGTLPEVTPPVDQTAVEPPTVVPNQTVPQDQSQRLARLQEIRRKGFVSEDEAIEVGTGGKNRKERLANLEKAIEQESSQGGAAPPLPPGVPDETQVQPNEESTVQGQARVQGEQEARIEGGEQQAVQGDDGTEVQVAPRKFSYQNGRVQVEVPPPYQVGGKSIQPFVMNGKTYLSADEFRANAAEAYAETVKRYPDLASQEAVPVSGVAQPPVTPAPQVEATVERAMDIESRFGLSAADGHFFNVAIDAVAANPSKWTTLAEGIQKEALKASVAAKGSLEKVGDIKLAKAIAERYLSVPVPPEPQQKPSTVGSSEGVPVSPTVSSDALETPGTRMGEAEGEKRSSEARAETGARRMEPTEEGRPADGKPIMPGDRFLTNTGRETTPYPKYSGSTNRQAIASEKKSQLWLMENAIAEAESRGDDFNSNMFRGELEDAKKGRLPQASKDSATLYVFGDSIPKVPKPILKEPSKQPRSSEPTGEQDTGTERELSGNRTGTEQPEAGGPTTMTELLSKGGLKLPENAVTQKPDGKWGFSGKVSGSLKYETESGGVPTDEDFAAIQEKASFGERFARDEAKKRGLRVRSFESKEAAEKALAELLAPTTTAAYKELEAGFKNYSVTNKWSSGSGSPVLWQQVKQVDGKDEFTFHVVDTSGESILLTTSNYEQAKALWDQETKKFESNKAREEELRAEEDDKISREKKKAISDDLESRKKQEAQTISAQDLDKPLTGKPIVVTGFHGSKESFTEFDPSRVGETDPGFLGPAYYFYADESLAKKHGKNVIRRNLRLNKPLDYAQMMEAKKGSLLYEVNKRYDEVFDREMEFALAQDRKGFGEQPAYWRARAFALATISREFGYDGVVMRGGKVQDFPNTEIAVFDAPVPQPAASSPTTTAVAELASDTARIQADEPAAEPLPEPPIPKFTQTTSDKGSTTRQSQSERVEKARADIADLERKRRAKQGEHDKLRSNATKKRAAVRGEIESLNRMIGKIEGEIAADMASDTLAKLEDELESPRSYDHYLAGMKAIHRLKAGVAEDAARRGEMGREAARADVAKERSEADRFDAELQGRAKEIAKSQGFDSGDAEQIALAASNGFTVFEDRSLADIVEVQGNRTRESRVSQEIGKMFSPNYSAKQDLSDEQKEAFKKQYEESSQDDKNWLAKRGEVDKAVREAIQSNREAIRQREDAERKEEEAEKAKDEQEALANARERAKKYFLDERISKALKKQKPKTKPVTIRRESVGGPVKVVDGKTTDGDQKGELYPNGLILHKSFEEGSKDFVLTHSRSGLGFPFAAKKSDMQELIGLIDLLGVDFNVDTGEKGALPSELQSRIKKINTAWDNGDYSMLSEQDYATVEALAEVTKTDIDADLILTADDLGANGIPPGLNNVMTDKGLRLVKEMAIAVPEFAYDPVFTVKDGKLLYRDGYEFKLEPTAFNLHPSKLKEGQTVGINLEDLGIKRSTPQDVVAEVMKGSGLPRVTKGKGGDVSVGYVGSIPTSLQQGESDNDWVVVGGSPKVRDMAIAALKKIRWRQPGQDGDPKTDINEVAASSEPQTTDSKTETVEAQPKAESTVEEGDSGEDGATLDVAESSSLDAFTSPELQNRQSMGAAKTIIASASDLVGDDTGETGSEYASPDKEFERRWQMATKGIGKKTLATKLREFWQELVKSTVRGSLPELPRTEQFGEARSAMHAYQNAPVYAQLATADLLKKTSKPLSASDYDLFTRIVIMRDQMEAADKGERLSYGLTPAKAKAELARVEALAANNERVQASLEYRKQWTEAMVNDFLSAHEYLGLDMADRFKRENYFRHQVLYYMEAQQRGLGKKKVELTPNRGWLKGRTSGDDLGEGFDINANYLQAEWEVSTQMIADTKRAQAIGRLKRHYDKMRQLKAQAKQNNYVAVVGGQKVMDEIEELRGLMEELRSQGSLDSGEKAQMKEWSERLWELDPTMPFRRDMAIAREQIDGIADSLGEEVPDDFMRYVSALAKRDDSPLQGPALAFLKAVSDRKAFIKSELGDNYQTWEDVVPDDHEEVAIRPGRAMFQAYSVPEQIASELMADLSKTLGISAEDLRPLTALGSKYTPLVVPKEVAAQMAAVDNKMDFGWLDHMVTRPMNAWKRWVLMSPTRVLKYNLRNLSEIDKVMALNPAAIKDIPQAIRDLWKLYSGADDIPATVRDWVERGGSSTLVRVNELGELNELKQFAKLISDKKSGVVGKVINAPVNLWKTYWSSVGIGSDFRESIFRYAAYLNYVKQLEAGKLTNYGGSVRSEVEGIKDNKDKAMRLSADLLGDYGDISLVGQFMRSRAAPFWSFQETNVRTYFRGLMNLAGNEQSAIKAGMAVARAAGIGGLAKAPFLAYKLGRIAILFYGLKAMTTAFNQLLFADDDDELTEEEKRKAHLTFGKNSKGEVQYFSRIGTAADVLDWVGLDSVDYDLRDVLDGRRTLRDVLNDMTRSPVDKAYGMLSPFIKLPTELAVGQTAYPSVGKPRPIRDRGQYIAQNLGLRKEYDKLVGNPATPYSFTDIVLYKVEPGTSAYYMTQDAKYRWLKEARNRGVGYSDSVRGNALRSYKMALRLNDKVAVDKYLAEYEAAGGTKEGMLDSLESSHPAGGLSTIDAYLFYKSLVPVEQAEYKEAERFYYSELLTEEQAKTIRARREKRLRDIAIGKNKDGSPKGKPEKQRDETTAKYRERLRGWEEQRKIAREAIQEYKKRDSADLQTQ